MTKIIWVTGGLVDTSKLAEALREVKSRECLIVKVPNVQEAICALCEGPEPASLVICDQKLDMSIPPRQLRHLAEMKDIPYLVATHAPNEDEKLLTRCATKVSMTGPIHQLLSMLQIVFAPRAVDIDFPPNCAAIN